MSISFADATSTILFNGSESYASEHGSLPYYAPSLLRVLQTPQTFTDFGAESPVQPENLPGGLAVDCLSVAAQNNSVVKGPRKPVHEVCLDHDADDLRVVVDDSQEFIRDDIFSFGGQRPARHVHLRVGGVVIGEAEITKLETVSLDETAFAPTPDLRPVEKPPARLSGPAMAGRILSHENPKYPGLAKAAHIQGVVILHAIIGTDGRIANLSVISSPDKLLSEASLKAVSKWTYEPYLLDGKPTAVDTTITVNFAIGK
jgi:TonB family protein